MRTQIEDIKKIEKKFELKKQEFAEQECFFSVGDYLLCHEFNSYSDILERKQLMKVEKISYSEKEFYKHFRMECRVISKNNGEFYNHTCILNLNEEDYTKINLRTE